MLQCIPRYYVSVCTLSLISLTRAAIFAGPSSDDRSKSIPSVSAWPLVGGALVSHGSLIRVRPLSDAISLSLLCGSSSRSECDFLAHVTGVQGWVLDFDHQSNSWHIFLFCFLREVYISSEHLVVLSCIPMSLALGDLVLALRCGSLRSLVDYSEFDVERASCTVVAVHSKLIQLEEEGTLNFDDVCSYRDFLSSLPEDAWLQYIFLPDPSMLPSYLLS